MDLSLYKVSWVTGCDEWWDGAVVAARQPPLEPEDKLTCPVMEHQEVVLRRPQARSFSLDDASTTEGYTIVQFDGGASGKRGTGGTLVWGPGG